MIDPNDPVPDERASRNTDASGGPQPSFPFAGASPAFRRQAAAASVVLAGLALVFYVATLLPGQDLGDTAFFQATAGSNRPTARDAYPLYYAVGHLFTWFSPENPARALNLVSAVFGALAVGAVCWVTAMAAGSVAGGAFAAALLASSYTFWSHAVIAEVYTLHLFLMAACLAALLAWATRPARARLALFFALYAVSAGNHLSTILLAPGFALFVLLAAPGGPRSVLRPPIVAMAAAFAALGASQYLWNVTTVTELPGTRGLGETLASLWFDVTKSDWRSTLVLGAPTAGHRRRLAMCLFDLRQQIGAAGIAASVIGLPYLVLRLRRLAIAWLTLFGVSWGFAFTYNVGDAYVFFLPAHLLVACSAGFGAAAILAWLRGIPAFRGTAPGSRERAGWRRPVTLTAAAVLLAYPAWRAYDVYPAVDRSDEGRATAIFEAFTANLDADDVVIGVDLNWQLENGMTYYARHVKPELATFDVVPALLYFPYIAAANLVEGREVVLGERAARAVTSAYGTLFRIEPDTRAPAPGLADAVRGLLPGTGYVVSLLAPDRDFPFDDGDVAAGLEHLTGEKPSAVAGRQFVVIAGEVGRPPVFRAATDRPFRTTVTVAGVDLDIRMESWLPTDTIRRAGFGHVIAGRRRLLMLERGVSLVAFDRAGTPVRSAYACGLLAPLARYVIRPPAVRAGGRSEPGSGVLSYENLRDSREADAPSRSDHRPGVGSRSGPDARGAGGRDGPVRPGSVPAGS